MAYRLSALRGSRIAARDGAGGLLIDLLFDERTLQLRYVAIDSGHRQPGRRILAPAAHAALEAGGVRIDLTRAQLRRCISVDTDRHLFSGRGVEGYRIEAIDGALGQVEDVLVAGDGSIDGVSASTRDWLLPGRRVEIPAAAIVAFDPAQRLLRVRLTRDQMRSG
jgi:hypothetical protein